MKLSILQRHVEQIQNKCGECTYLNNKKNYYLPISSLATRFRSAIKFESRAKNLV